MLRKILLLFGLVVFVGIANSQTTEAYNEDLRLLKEGKRQYENNNFEYARHLFNDFLEEAEHRETEDLYTLESKLYLIKIAFDLEQDFADNLVESFQNETNSYYLLNQAYMYQGDYYFNKKDYTASIIAYEKVKREGLNFYLEDEVKFKLAYSYFVKRQFEKASVLFKELSLTERKYFYPSHYYYGICQFLVNDFERAINSFTVIQNTEEYKQYVPYYLVQLYFTQGDYDKTISVGQEKLKIKGVENYKKIHHLIGQAYFLKKEYENALPHLEIYVDKTDKVRVEDFYQLGFIYQKLGQCEKAIPAFKEIANTKNAMSQNANYYLANCYIKTNDKESARTAFKYAGDMDFNKTIQEESMLNYGKLSAEMGYDREAIRSLLSISDDSQYYLEAQKVLKNIFINTNDYGKAQETLEKIDNVSSELFEAYQTVCFYKALQEINDNKISEAIEDLYKSEKVSRDLPITIRTHYWLGDLLHRTGEYIKSNEFLDRYFVLIKGVEGADQKIKNPVAYYTQGYNYYKLKSYPYSIEKFSKSISLLKKLSESEFQQKNMLMADANLRIADAFFHNKQLDKAEKHYNYVITRNAANTDYAMFQNATIAGLNGKDFDKIAILDKIVSTYKKSAIRPNALMELGNIYTEINQYEKAYNVYNQIIQDYPDKTNLINNSHLKLGLISYNKGSVDDAIANYKSVLSNNPNADNKKEALTSLEEIYINDKKNANEYIEYVKTVPGVAVENIYKDSLNYTTAKLYFDEDSIDKAIELFDEYLGYYTQGYYALDAYYYRAESYLTKKKYKAALKDFEYIIKQGFNPYYESSLYKAAIISFNSTGNYSKALKYYSTIEDIVKDENKKYDIQLGAMRSAFRLNNFAAVSKYGKKILQNPLTTDKERSAAHYYIGKVAEENGKYDTALNNLNKVIKQNRNSNWAAEARYRIAKVYYQRGETELAKKLIKKANAKNTAYPYWVAKGLILTSDLFVKEKDLFNGRAALEAVLENYRDDKQIIKEVEKKLENIKKLEEENSRIEKKNEDGTLILDSMKVK